jgi:glucuronoarabinoxylan endo-1,4-beta-xylanase
MLKKYALLGIILAISSFSFAQIVIDAGKIKQRIDGFGASTAWHGMITTAEADAAFKNETNNQMGLSILRVRIDPSSSNWNDEKQNAIKAKTRGAIILASPWTPPYSLKTNNSLIGGELKTDSYAAYATHLKNFCTSLGNVDIVSLQNEPNITVKYESCTWNSSQMLDFCRNNAASIGIPVMVPETFNFDPAFSDPVLNDSAANSNFSYIGGHIYGSKAFSYTNAINKGKKVWMTEHYYDGDTIEVCMTMAKEIMDCMYFNMNAYVWWYLRQPGCNLMNSGGSLKKKGFTMAQFSKFVRPGYYRIESTYSPVTGVVSVAFKGPTQDVIIVMNKNTLSKTQKFTFKNDTVPSVTKFTTTKTKNISEEGIISCSNNSFTDTFEPMSINTYVTNKIYTNVRPKVTPDIMVYPNPVSDYLQFSSINDVNHLLIYNLIGQQLISIDNPEEKTIDVSKLKPGVYLLKINESGIDKCIKFIKN